MTRREFLKGAAGLVLAAGAGFGGTRALTELLKPNASTALGPLPIEGLSLLPTSKGADVLYEGRTAFTVNTTGAALLRLADGTRSLDEIIARAGASAYAADAAMFFVTLGQAGYLQNRVEVAIYENRV
ncbi:MAG: PqqD family protein [Clostridiales bacterium]|nr:PqqD family protein [Clostridiales bacterium]